VVNTEENHSIREPKQTRSIQTKEKILDTAYSLFCAKGYYNTSTNEIAKEAGVSIGSIYSYFKNKDTILLEILRRYHQEFAKSTEDLSQKLEAYRSDMRAWLRHLIDNLIRLHENGRELIREMETLSFSKPEVAALLRNQQEESRLATLEFLRRMKDDVKYPDLEAAATVAYDTISVVVHRIVFDGCEIGRERIIKACIEEVYSFLAE
jgi:AcrR family transcriptional regulator